MATHPSFRSSLPFALGFLVPLQAQGATSDPLDAALRALADPNLAYLLLVLGFLGFFLELSSPGTTIPGAIGAVALDPGRDRALPAPLRLARGAADSGGLSPLLRRHFLALARSAHLERARLARRGVVRAVR